MTATGVSAQAPATPPGAPADSGSGMGSAAIRAPGAHALQDALVQQWKFSKTPAGKEAVLVEKLDYFARQLNADYRKGSGPQRQFNWRPETAIMVDGKPSGAYHMHLGTAEGKRAGTAVAICSPYPKMVNLEAYLDMLFQEQPAVLVILASDAEIHDANLREPPGEKQAAGYFRAPPDTENLHCSSQALASWGTLEKPAEIEHYMMSLQQKTQAGVHDPSVVRVPVVCINSCPDGEAIPDELMSRIEEIVRSVEMTAEAGAPERLRASHCKEGFGRAGQFTASFILPQHHQEIISVEDLVRALRQSRGKDALFQPSQQIAVARSAAQFNIQPLSDNHRGATSADLAFLGIAGLPEIVGSDVVNVMPALKSDLYTFGIDREHAPALLKQVEENRGPFILEGMKNGRTVTRMLWNGNDENGRDLNSCMPRQLSAQAFIQQHVDNPGHVDGMKLTVMPPSQELGDMALFAAQPASALQEKLLQTLLASEESIATDNVADMGRFLSLHGVEAHATRCDIAMLLQHRTVLEAALRQSDNFTIEFADHRVEGAPLVRVNVRSMADMQAGQLECRFYQPPGGEKTIDLGSFDELAEQVLAGLQHGADPRGFSILSSTALPGLPALQ